MQATTRCRRVRFAASTALIALTSFVGPASAHSLVDQPLTLRDSTFEIGLGLGLAHRDVADYTGLGINLELGYGLTSTLELRFRTGLRLQEAGRVTDADYFGRPVQTETYNLGSDTLANPQIGLRFLLSGGPTLQLGFDAHAILPRSGDFGLLLGVPMAVRLGSRLRLDTGLFLPIFLTDPGTIVDISIPIHLWIKVDSTTFLGPMTGIYLPDGGGRRVPFGVGVGSSISYDAEVRFWLLIPDVREDSGAKNFGLGAGLYVLF